MRASNTPTALSDHQVARLHQVGNGLEIDQVLGDRVLVETVVPDSDIKRIERSGLLAIPESVKGKYDPQASTGVILKVGDEVNEDFSGLKPGVMVIFSKYSGSDWTIDEHEGLKILDTSEILATLRVTTAQIVPVKEEE